MAFPRAEELHDFLLTPVAELGLELEQVSARPAGKKSVVEVTVDADERPGLDTLEEVSRRLSELLDAAEAEGTFRFGAGYTLQVSTPGVDAPLRQARHWRRNRGRLVEISGAGRAPETWRIGPLNEDETVVALVGPHGTITSCPIAEVPRAVVQVEFSCPPQAEVDATRQDFSTLTSRTHAEPAETPGAGSRKGR